MEEHEEQIDLEKLSEKDLLKIIIRELREVRRELRELDDVKRTLYQIKSLTLSWGFVGGLVPAVMIIVISILKIALGGE